MDRRNALSAPFHSKHVGSIFLYRKDSKYDVYRRLRRPRLIGRGRYFGKYVLVYTRWLTKVCMSFLGSLIMLVAYGSNILFSLTIHDMIVDTKDDLYRKITKRRG